MATVAVYGLSANPPHVGHVAIVRMLASCGMYDGVVVVPCGGRPEPSKSDFVEAIHRLAMCQLAFSGLETARTWVDVDEEDVHQPFFTPHVELMERMRSRRGVRLVAAIGSDLILARPELDGKCELETWAQAERLLANWDMVVLNREGLPRGSMLRMPHRATTLSGERIPAVRSTDVRERVARGEPIDHLVPPSVARYIRDHNLYR